jgi:hypothetical protein
MRLDLEPDLEAGLGLPDGSHFRAGIAGNHRKLRTSWAGREASPADCFLRRALADRVPGNHPCGPGRGKTAGLRGRRPPAATGWPARTRRPAGRAARRFACRSWS